MYKININGHTHQTTQDKQEAWVCYRAIASKNDNKPNLVELWHNDSRLYAKAPNMMLLETVGDTSINDVLLIILKAADIDKKRFKELVKIHYPTISGSRVDGWCRPTDDRRHIPMQADDLVICLQAVCRLNKLMQYSAANVRQLRDMLGLSQSALAAELGVTDRQVRNWEAGTSVMSADKWQKMQQLTYQSR
ncbi:MAG: helix-turn-helix transcriptional regulator [Moraxella sp.]|nr:helix-turn-helix transcriptional regulator [Moraxella sp.]